MPRDADLTTFLNLPEGERRLGPYALLAELGQGGSAPVWLAREEYGSVVLRAAAVKLFPLGAADEGAGADEKVRQVAEEARVLSTVEHPNVVRFYSLQADPRRRLVGLAMEYAAGVSLEQSLAARAGPLDLDETLAVGAALASALAAVHAAGLLHRDIKPANVVRCESGYKLIDFGLASAEAPGAAADVRREPLTPGNAAKGRGGSASQGAMGESGSRPRGTLGYVDPACVAGRASATTASDLYALGATLFELLTARLPAAGRGAIDERVLDGRDRAPPLASITAGLPPPLTHLIDALLDPDQASRPRSSEWAALELERVRQQRRGLARPLPPENVGPFRGLGRFEADDRDVYFGRAAEVVSAIEALRAHGLVTLLGPSGSGKSSLARAGVAPAVSEGALGWPRRWDVALTTPGRDPWGAITGALAPLTGTPALDTPEAWSVMLASRSRAAERGLLLVVDQLEGLAFASRGEPAGARAKATALLNLLSERVLPGVRVLATARHDMLEPLLTRAGLGRAIFRGSVQVAPLADAAWGEVVERSLDAYGYRFESEELRDRVTSEIQALASAMPLVQFALTRLWERRDRAAKTIDAAAVEAVGGIAGALETHADATLAHLARLDPGAVERARAVLLSLTTLQGTRASRSDDELPGDAALTRDVLGVLESERIVVREAGRVTLAHEALLGQWARLRSWLDEVRKDRWLANDIEDAARRWVESPDEAGLLVGGRLLAAEDLAQRGPVTLTPEARRFVTTSRRGTRRGRRVVAATVTALVAVAAASGAAYVRQTSRQIDALRGEVEGLRRDLERSSAHGRRDEPGAESRGR